MAKAEHIKALIQSHYDGDHSRFLGIAMQIMANADNSGHERFANELCNLLDKCQAKHLEAATRKKRPMPTDQPSGDLAGLLAVSNPNEILTDMALESSLCERLELVLREQRHRDKLRSHGFEPQRKLLLIGPPGTGKTMTASVLAGQLGLPLFMVKLDGLITKFMGETAAKLSRVFRAIAETRGVYLFDEFDSIGGHRGAGNDVGEIRRVLSSFLQFIEQDASDSLIIGATNNVDLLDQALFRRFDAVLKYDLPSSSIALKVIQSRLVLLDTSGINWEPVISAARGLNHADLTCASEQAAKNALLNDESRIETEGLVAALNDRNGIPLEARVEPEGDLKQQSKDKIKKLEREAKGFGIQIKVDDLAYSLLRESKRKGGRKDIHLCLISGGWQLHSGNIKHGSAWWGLWGITELHPNTPDEDFVEIAISLLADALSYGSVSYGSEPLKIRELELKANGLGFDIKIADISTRLYCLHRESKSENMDVWLQLTNGGWELNVGNPFSQYGLWSICSLDGTMSTKNFTELATKMLHDALTH